MKEFISKNWKKIFYIILGCWLAIDLYYIITTPATVTEDFLEYGPTAEKDIFDSVANTSDEISEGALIFGNGSTALLIRAAILMAIFIGTVVLFTYFFGNSEEPAKKK